MFKYEERINMSYNFIVNPILSVTTMSYVCDIHLLQLKMISNWKFITNSCPLDLIDKTQIASESHSGVIYYE